MDDKTIRRVLTYKYRYYIIGLCSFIWFLSFKPSEPYLSEYLICNYNTQLEYCQTFTQPLNCQSNQPCNWSYDTSTCSPTNCNDVSSGNCNNNNEYYNYCEYSNNICENSYCYKSFSENQVNNDIYPWSTYAYFPFLLFLGPYAEIFSYRIAILVGISGRVITRFLLIYGNSLTQMQIMQVTYSMGTAAEDVFSAYIYYAVPQSLYTDVTAYVKSSALLASLLSGVLGDLLVTQANTSLTTLMVISAVFVCTGAFLGLFVILPSNKTYNHLQSQNNENSSNVITWKMKYQIKLEQFKHQLLYLRNALRNKHLSTLVVYWIFGNAVFTIIYGYEVSIYQELNGSSDWNGSVLSIMLLGGSFGALLPTYLHYDRSGNQITMKKKSFYLLIAEIISIMSLLLSIYIWETIFTVSLLTIYFTSWQYINVIAFSDLAHGLKQSQIDYNYTDNYVINEFVAIQFDSSNHSNTLNNDEIENKEIDRNKPDPPYSIAIVSIVCLCVLVQITFQSVLFSGLQLSLHDALWNILYIYIATSALYSFYLIVSTIILND